MFQNMFIKMKIFESLADVFNLNSRSYVALRNIAKYSHVRGDTGIMEKYDFFFFFFEVK